MKQIVSIALNIPFLTAPGVFAASLDEKASEILEYYCFDCHDAASQKGNLNMEELLKKDSFDGALIFEDQPEAEEKRAVSEWLIKRQKERPPKSSSTHTADDGLKPSTRP